MMLSKFYEFSILSKERIKRLQTHKLRAAGPQMETAFNSCEREYCLSIDMWRGATQTGRYNPNVYAQRSAQLKMDRRVDRREAAS